MDNTWLEFIQLDFPPLLMLLFTSSICAISGNYVVLVKRSLMSDGVSHSVLPGIVLGFLVSGSFFSFWLVVGAIISASIGLYLTEWLIKTLDAEPNAVTGAVFTFMLALGVFMLEKLIGTRVHLDIDHVLFGGLEQIIWLEIDSLDQLLDWQTWLSFPSSILWAGTWLVLLLMGIVVMGRAIVIACFDPIQASMRGYNARRIHNFMMLVLMVTAVLSFRAVGSILVIMLFVSPAATMRVLTDKIRQQVIGSVVIALVASILGYVMSVFFPMLLGLESSLSVGGMVSFLLFVLFLLSVYCTRVMGFRLGYITGRI